MQQLNIVFAMHVEKGHVCAGFRLARTLQERGHRVAYLGMKGSEALVLENGFEFVPYAEDLLPANGSQPGITGQRLFSEFIRLCVNGHLDERLRRAKPDLLICDSLIWYVGLRALSLGIPVVSFAAPTTGCPDANVPPSVQARIPGRSRLDRARVRLDWRLLRLKFFFTKRIASRVTGSSRTPTRIHNHLDVFQTMAKQAGVPCREGKTYRYTEFGPHLILPEIALLPKALEFPNARARNVCHLGDLSAPPRTEDTRLLDRLDAEKPLVYCSLGSAPHTYPHTRRFFRTVVEASRLRTDWQWVAAVGGQLEPEMQRCAGGNLIVVDWAPQIALLGRARAMVTHGGLGSIVECIRFGVPMVIVPGGRDQPGNMARAVCHGIALAADMAKLTAEELVTKVERAMKSDGIRDALAQMRSKIAADRGLEAAVALVESAVRTPESRTQR